MDNYNEKKYSDDELRKIEEFKNQFKKTDNNQIIKEQKVRTKSDKTLIKRIAPYFYTTIIFFISLLILYLVFDKWLIPSMVHDKKLVLVPEVVGKTTDEAEQIITNNDLVFEYSGEQYSENYPEGVIVNQIPKAKTEVKSDRPVFLTVSKGKEKVSVPYLLGRSLREAKIELISRGLVLGDIKYEFSNDFPKDTIIEQSIKSGQMIAYGSMISLKISKGSENQVAVPVLIGRRIEDIESILSEYNLKLGNVTYKKSETFMANSIIESFPSQNSIVQEGTAINIVVSK